MPVRSEILFVETGCFYDESTEMDVIAEFIGGRSVLDECLLVSGEEPVHMHTAP